MSAKAIKEVCPECSGFGDIDIDGHDMVICSKCSGTGSNQTLEIMLQDAYDHMHPLLVDAINGSDNDYEQACLRRYADAGRFLRQINIKVAPAFLEFVESISRLKMHSEMDGGLDGDDSIQAISSLIMRARRLLFDAGGGYT